MHGMHGKLVQPAGKVFFLRSCLSGRPAALAACGDRGRRPDRSRVCWRAQQLHFLGEQSTLSESPLSLSLTIRQLLPNVQLLDHPWDFLTDSPQARLDVVCAHEPPDMHMLKVLSSDGPEDMQALFSGQQAHTGLGVTIACSSAAMQSCKLLIPDMSPVPART